MDTKKIVVADDDESILEVIQLILEGDERYEVATTSQADCLLEDLKHLEDLRHLPDLILLDIWMAGIDGRDICKSLKTNDRTKDIPVILISANRNLEEITRYSLANDFIEKPFDMNNLLEKVGSYIK